MRWQLILEEFGPELIYIEGSTNIVADALSCLKIIDNLNSKTKNNKVESTLENMSENFALINEDITLPTSFKTIMRFQQQANSLTRIA